MAFHRLHGTEWSPLPGLPHEDPDHPCCTGHPGRPIDPRLVGRPPQCGYPHEPTSETTVVCIRWNAPLAHVAGFLS